MGSPLRIVQANIGTNEADMNLFWRALKPNEDEEKMNLDIGKRYPEIEARTARTLSDLAADVYLMQEVGARHRAHKSRPILQELDKRNLQIIKTTTYKRKIRAGYEELPYENADTVIALNPERFKKIKDWSTRIVPAGGQARDVAIAAATDTISKQRLLFVSYHSTGFSFKAAKEYYSTSRWLLRILDIFTQYVFKYRVYHPTEEEEHYLKQYSQCEALANALTDTIAQIGKEEAAEAIIIGADMNATPENSRSLFNMIQRSLDLNLFRTNRPTELNPDEGIDLTHREIDYLFISKNYKFKQLHIPEISLSDPNSNSSDHLPISVTLSRA